MYNEIIFCVLLSFPLCIVIYNFLPMVYISVYFGKDRWMKRDHESDIISKILSFLPFSNLLKKRIISRIEEAGIGDGRTWIFWLFMTLVLPVIVLILNISARAGMLSSVCIATGTAVIPEIWLNNRIASRKSVFIKNTYKIYSFLHTQISAGIKPTDAVKGMFEIADHNLIKDTFIRFTARFELTLDIDESLQIIRRSFRGYDGEMLCVCIKQCIETGTAGRTLLKMEELMFSKYFNITQRETERYKTKLLISGLIGLVPVIMILCLPMIFEAVSGFLTMLEV